MLDGLISGRLIQEPTIKPSKQNGKPQARVVVAGKQLDGNDAIITGFTQRPDLIERLRVLQRFDAIALSGDISLSYWEKDGEKKPNLTMRIHGVLTAYHVGRKRKGAEVEGDHDDIEGGDYG